MMRDLGSAGLWKIYTSINCYFEIISISTTNYKLAFKLVAREYLTDLIDLRNIFKFANHKLGLGYLKRSEKYG